MAAPSTGQLSRQSLIPCSVQRFSRVMTRLISETIVTASPMGMSTLSTPMVKRPKPKPVTPCTSPPSTTISKSCSVSLKTGLRRYKLERQGFDKGRRVAYHTAATGCYPDPARASNDAGLTFGEGRHGARRLALACPYPVRRCGTVGAAQASTLAVWPPR